jgi:hypothetical protein
MVVALRVVRRDPQTSATEVYLMVRRYRRSWPPTKMHCSPDWRYRIGSGSQPWIWRLPGRRLRS